MNELIKKLTTPTQPAKYISIEAGTPEYEAADGFLKWAGKDGGTHIFSDRGEPGVFERFVKMVEQA